MKVYCGILALAGGVAATCADATPVIYNSGAAFNAAAGTVTSVDFEGCTAGAVLNPDETVGDSGACSGIASGVAFAPFSGDNLYIFGANQSANPTIALGLDNSLGGGIAVTFANAATAFGSDLFQNIGTGEQSGVDSPFLVQLFNGNTQVASYNVSVASGTGSFFGIVGSPAFDRVTISQADGFAVLDNVRFGATAGVPEPATWAMMLGGFGAMGFAMRRRRAINTSVAFA